MSEKDEKKAIDSTRLLLDKPYDVLVYGNDPAGFYCAQSAAKKGLQVLHLQSSSQMGMFPEWITVQYCNPLIGSLTTSHPRDLLIQETGNVQFHWESGELKKRKLGGFVYDSKELRNALFIQSRSLNINTLTGTLFKKLHPNAMEIDYSGESYFVSAKCIVVADGIRSPIRKSLNLESENYLAALQYRVKLSKELKTVHFFGDSENEDGFGWFIPRGKFANVGFGVYRAIAQELMFKLHHLLDQLIQQEFIVSDELKDKQGGLLPVGGPCIPPGRDGVLFVGDAAGLRDPLSPGIGTGIGLACQSAIRAGEFIAEEIKKNKTPRVEGYLSCINPLLEGKFHRAALLQKNLGTTANLQK